MMALTTSILKSSVSTPNPSSILFKLFLISANSFITCSIISPITIINSYILYTFLLFIKHIAVLRNIYKFNLILMVKMAKVLIATVYGPDPVLVATNKLGPDRLILFVDQEPSKEQENSINLIKNSLGRVIDV